MRKHKQQVSLGRYQERSKERLIRFGIAIRESEFVLISELVRETGDSRNALLSNVIRRGLLNFKEEIRN